MAEKILHPLSILSQPAEDLNTVLHSFFVLSYNTVQNSIDVLSRHPRIKKNIDEIELGLKQLLSTSLTTEKRQDEDRCISYITKNNDCRLYLFIRSFNHKFIAFVSHWPIFTFFRNFCQFIENDVSIDAVLPYIYTLCEFPILALPSIDYKFIFGKRNATISFGSLCNLEQEDFDAIALTTLTPYMMVKAWEAIIVERNVIVTSKDTSLLLPCCEFLKKIISPMTLAKTHYIPVIPALDCLDSTGSYVMGVDLKMLTENDWPLPGVVILNLDRSTVIHTPTAPGEEPYIAAPPLLLQRMVEEIESRIKAPVGDWFERPISKTCSIEESHSPASYSKRCTEILKYFSFINISLLSPQFCTVSGFFRKRIEEKDVGELIHQIFGIEEKTTNELGCCQKYGFVFGCVQLWKDIEVKIEHDYIEKETLCWIEMDSSMFAVYEYADDLPLFLISLEEIISVNPCSREPIDHVFDVVLRTRKLRFTCGSSSARNTWIALVDSNKNALRQRSPSSVSASIEQRSSFSSSSSAIATVEQISCPNFYEYYNLVADSKSSGPANKTPVVEGHKVVKSGSFTPFSSKMLQTLVISSLDERFLRHYEDFRHAVFKTNYYHSLNEFSQSTTIEKISMLSGNKDFTNYLNPHHSYSTKLLKCFPPKTSADVMVIEEDKAEPPRVKLSTLEVPSAVKPSADLVTKVPFSESAPADSSNVVSIPKLSPVVTESVKKTFLSRFFSGISRKGTDVASPQSPSPPLAEPSNIPTSSLPEKDHMKDAIERRISKMRSTVSKISFAYQDALIKINNHILEDRYPCFEELINESDNGKLLNLTFILKDILGINEESSIDNKAKDDSIQNFINLHNALSEQSFVISSCMKFTSSNSLSPPPHSVALDESLSPLGLPESRSSFSVGRVSFQGLGPLIAPPSTPRLLSVERENSFPTFENINQETESAVDIKTFLLENEFNALLHATVKDRLLNYFQSIENKERKIRDEMNHVKSGNNNDGNLGKGSFPPIIKALTGYLLLNSEDYLHAIQSFASSRNLVHESHISYCLLRLFIQEYKNIYFHEQFNEISFIKYFNQIQSTIGIHAYRLMLELLRREIKTKIRKEEKDNEINILDSSADFATIRVILSGENVRRRRSIQLASIGAKFESIPNPNHSNRSEVMNGANTCTRLLFEGNEKNYCKLSYKLLLSLKEMIKAYCGSPSGIPHTRRINHNTTELMIDNKVLNDLRNLTSFQNFEKETCQLQKVDLKVLRSDGTVPGKSHARIVFFINVYNMLRIHATIRKGIPGTSPLERGGFMTTNVYNIGGYYFSLLDIENGILRNASTQVTILGPLLDVHSFAEKDPRRDYAIHAPIPNLSFCLYTASKSSPTLCIFKDFYTLSSDMKRYAKQYLLDHIEYDINKKLIILPKIFDMYGGDFGGSKNFPSIINYIKSQAGNEFSQQLKDFLDESGATSVKPIYPDSYDWTPVFRFYDQ